MRFNVAARAHSCRFPFFFFIRSRNQADVVSRRLKPAEDFTSCLSLKSRGMFASLSNIVNVGMVN